MTMHRLIQNLAFDQDDIERLSEIAPMANHRPRSSYESDWLPYTKVTGRIAVRAAIGEALRNRYEVPQQRECLRFR